MILVTGATGLTGGKLVRRLSAMGVPVRALVRNTARPSLSSLPLVEIVEGDMAALRRSPRRCRHRARHAHLILSARHARGPIELHRGRRKAGVSTSSSFLE